MSISVGFSMVAVAEYSRKAGEWSFSIHPGEVVDDVGHRELTVLDTTLMEAHGLADLASATALAIELVREHLDEGYLEDMVHRVDGSEDDFQAAFADAFDIRLGDPSRLPTDDMTVEHVNDDS